MTAEGASGLGVKLTGVLDCVLHKIYIFLYNICVVGDEKERNNFISGVFIISLMKEHV